MGRTGTTQGGRRAGPCPEPCPSPRRVRSCRGSGRGTSRTRPRPETTVTVGPGGTCPGPSLDGSEEGPSPETGCLTPLGGPYGRVVDEVVCSSGRPSDGTGGPSRGGPARNYRPVHTEATEGS